MEEAGGGGMEEAERERRVKAEGMVQAEGEGVEEAGGEVEEAGGE